MVLVPDVNTDLLEIMGYVIDGIVALGLQVVFQRPVDESLRTRCGDFQLKHPHSVKILESSEIDREAFDVAIYSELQEDERSSLKETKIVPIAEEGSIEPFDPIQEKGFGFSYDQENPWTLFAALIRAMETHRFPYDWKTLLKAL